ncbi:MAG: AsmA-like C-terminal region-containing protein [Bacteroidota bacterium]|nr:AsmA-like C-terminal region-containing protein [Bacteroidota bacterium]
MKILLKILKFILTVSISIILTLYIFSLVFEKNISGIFIRELNKKLVTPVRTGEVNFSLLKRFPRASIDLNDVIIKSPRAENENVMPAYPDTLLYSGKMVLTLRIAELLRKNFVIDRIDIQNGVINICKAPSGKYNTNILKEPSGSDSSSMSLNINNVNINNSSFSYSVPGNEFFIGGRFKNSSYRITINENYIDLRSKAEIILSGLSTSSAYRLNSSHDISINTGMQISKDSILIGHSEIDIDGMKFKGSCDIETSSHYMILGLETENGQLNTLAEFLPGGVKNFFDKYGITGRVSGPIDLRGKYDKSAPLLMRASLEVGDGIMRIPPSNISLNNINTAAILKLDFNKSNKSFNLQSDSFSAQIGDTEFAGSFSLKKLVDPDIDIIISGLFQAADLTDLINIEGLQSSEGTIRLNARLSGSIPSQAGNASFNILGLDHSVNMGLNSINLKFPGFEGELENIQGNIMIADNVWLDNLSMNYSGQNIALNGMISGFNRWLAKEDDWLSVTAGLWSEKIDFGSFRDKFSFREEGDNKRDTRLKLNLSLISDSIISGNFRASLFEGNIAYMPGLMDITSFSMNTLGGSLAGNAVLSGLRDDTYEVRGWFNIENIDISETFSVSNNFRQDYIKSENIEGNITGDISLSATTDKQLRINKKDLALNGEYTILNGRLVDFEPAYKLSRFIELEELERIEFSKLENELIINNEMVTIPKMDISSSAFNISLEGNHSFNGNYEYHLKVLLSELLSNKKNSRVSEFGLIEDDGLGRTSLYLRINGDREGSRVSHDSEALRSQIKDDLRREKQTIKSILQEEYGLYAGDSIPGTNTRDSRRFRITWEETDSIRTQVEESGEKKLPLIRLFKKKDKKKEQSEKK